MIIRTAAEKDIEGLLQVFSAAFNRNLEKNSDKLNAKKISINDDLQQWRVMIDDDKITGAVHIKKSWLHIGKTKILKGDIGDVCIHPEIQGRGLGTVILEDTIKWMKKNNYDLSRLGGLCKYYSRFGYQRFFRRYFEFNVGTIARAGASRITEGIIPVSNGDLAKIRPYEPIKDHESALKLHESFSCLYNGSRILDSKEKETPTLCENKDPLNLVYAENDKILGHIQVAESKNEISDFEARIRIYLYGYDKSKPVVIQALLAYINNYAFEKGIKRMTARMPFDSDIIQALTELPIRFKTIETYGGMSGNMLQIINLKSLLSRIKPELEERLLESINFNWNGTLQLKTKKDSASINFENGKISVAPSNKADVTINVTEIQLLNMILGMTAFSELDSSENNNISTEIKMILNSLFPRKPVFSANLG
jgi:predicted N-acetyltransferase YhbS